MRDQLDATMWVDHHDRFSAAVDDVLARSRGVFARIAEWDGSTHQLIALVLSFAITALSFNTTAA